MITLLLFVIFILIAMYGNSQNLQFVTTGANELGIRVTSNNTFIQKWRDSSGFQIRALDNVQSQLNSAPQNYVSADDTGRVWRTPLQYVRFVFDNVTGLSDSFATRLRTSALTSGLIASVLGFTPYNGTANPNGYINQSQARTAISLTTTGTSGAATYNNATGVLNIPQYTAPAQVNLTAGNGITITGSYPNLTISATTPTITIVTRPVNGTTFTPNATKPVFGTYTVTCQVTNPLLVGTSTATVFLEYSINGGSSWLEPARNGNSSGVGVTVTLQLTNGQTGTLNGWFPANALVRIRQTTTGTASVTYITGQETYF